MCIHVSTRQQQIEVQNVYQKDMMTQYQLKNDQYPKSLTSAVDFLMSAKFDPVYQRNKDKRKQQSRTKEREIERYKQSQKY